MFPTSCRRAARSSFFLGLLIELTAPGGSRAALTAPGYIHGVARVR